MLETHPELCDSLGIAKEHRTKPLMECVTSLAVYTEQDEDDTLLLTTWKHRPLIRYRSHDLAWMRPARDVVRTLNREMRGWGRDFARAGYGRGHIPRVAKLGMILGRADDVCIVNAANISPEMLRGALEASGIMPRLHHFKHYTEDARPNAYSVCLELNETVSEDERATDLAAAHRANPIELEIFVRSLGEDEFEGDDLQPKMRYVPNRQRAAVEVTAGL